MAPPQILSRSQRRHEQKQTVLVLALVVVVALLSFLAGIVVGRGLGRPEPAVVVAPAPAPRLPVPPPPAPPVAATAQESPPVPTAASISTRPEQLAFYDSLAKGEQPPLGSGINLPPPGTVPPPEPVADVGEKTEPVAPTTLVSKSPAAAPKSLPPAATTPAATTKPIPPVPLSGDKATVVNNPTPASKSPAKAVTTTTYVIQAASFNQAKEAADLSRKLSRKGYTPFVEAVDLGSKGVWHRVYVGPFSNVTAADKVAKRIKSEERLAPVVRKR